MFLCLCSWSRHFAFTCVIWLSCTSGRADMAMCTTSSMRRNGCRTVCSRGVEIAERVNKSSDHGVKLKSADKSSDLISDYKPVSLPLQSGYLMLPDNFYCEMNLNSKVTGHCGVTQSRTCRGYMMSWLSTRAEAVIISHGHILLYSQKYGMVIHMSTIIICILTGHYISHTRFTLTTLRYVFINPLSPHDALKHHSTSRKTYLKQPLGMTSIFVFS